MLKKKIILLLFVYQNLQSGHWNVWNLFCCEKKIPLTMACLKLPIIPAAVLFAQPINQSPEMLACKGFTAAYTNSLRKKIFFL
jgi:hypothetical protein